MPAQSTSQKQNWHRGRSYVAAPALSDTCNGAPLDPAEFVQSQAEDVAARREPGCRQLARRLCACPQQNFFGSEFSSYTNSVIGGNLEQSPLSAMSVLAERAVAALVPR